MLFSDFEINGNVYTMGMKLREYPNRPVEEDLTVYYIKNNEIAIHRIDFVYETNGYFKFNIVHGLPKYPALNYYLNRAFYYLTESV